MRIQGPKTVWEKKNMPHTEQLMRHDKYRTGEKYNSNRKIKLFPSEDIASITSTLPRGTIFVQGNEMNHETIKMCILIKIITSQIFFYKKLTPCGPRGR